MLTDTAHFCFIRLFRLFLCITDNQGEKSRKGDSLDFMYTLSRYNMNKKWINGFSTVKEMLHATGGVYEKNYFYYLCGLDNALRKCVARLHSRKGQLSWIR